MWMCDARMTSGWMRLSLHDSLQEAGTRTTNDSFQQSTDTTTAHFIVTVQNNFFRRYNNNNMVVHIFYYRDASKNAKIQNRHSLRAIT